MEMFTVFEIMRFFKLYPRNNDNDNDFYLFLAFLHSENYTDTCWLVLLSIDEDVDEDVRNDCNESLSTLFVGIYFLDRDPSIVGGDLRFKRAFSVAERSKVFWNVPQCRPQVVNTFSVEGFIPLGYFPTEQGYLLVFPNCHIHKIAKLINTSKDKAASRRIVVFFMVNPETRIISTSEVPPQQNTISLRRARNYRLELMAERKYDKEKLNVRDIELCEH